MRVVVLGSSAGDGLPEWRCACPSCRGSGAPRGAGKARSRDSLAVSADGRRWFLLNVSSDITHQLEGHAALGGRDGSALADGALPIAGAVLTNGALEQAMGLASLPASHGGLCLYATRETYAGLIVQSAVFRTLGRVRPPFWYRPLELDVFIPLRDASGAPSGLSLCAFPVPGELPEHLRSFMEPTQETNVGLIVRDDETDARILYVPGASSAEGIAARARDIRCLFFDGTLWSDAELAALGRSRGRGGPLAHVPVSGPDGSLEQLDALPIRRRFYTHVSESNPMLREGSSERRVIEARGWSVAEDGLSLWV